MDYLVDLEMIDRLDCLIRMKATGTPAKLARRLGISYSTLHENISKMKKHLRAPIKYNEYIESFEYEYEPDFYLGFEKL
jgi:hypothetical protein